LSYLSTFPQRKLKKNWRLERPSVRICKYFKQDTGLKEVLLKEASCDGNDLIKG
jgi:hypothetical protein